MKSHQNFDLKVIAQVLTLAFLCKNLDYKPQSINQSIFYPLTSHSATRYLLLTLLLLRFLTLDVSCAKVLQSVLLQFHQRMQILGIHQIWRPTKMDTRVITRILREIRGHHHSMTRATPYRGHHHSMTRATPYRGHHHSMTRATPYRGHHHSMTRATPYVGIVICLRFVNNS